MADESKKPKFVVTVLQDNTPIAMVSIQRASDNADEVDVYHENVEDLVEAFTKIGVARDALGYLYWKTTGVILLPVDGLVDELTGESPDAPF